MSSFRIIEVGDELALRIEGSARGTTLAGTLRLDADEATELAEVAGRLAALLRTRRGDVRPFAAPDDRAEPERHFPAINASGF